LPAIDATQQCGRAAFKVHHLTAERVRIVVTGDIDATNRQALGRFVERHIRVSQQLVLDLSKIDFFGSRGFTALHYVSVHCARRDADWMIVGNRAVRRILRVCDSEGELPVVDDLSAAVDRLDRCAKYHHSASRAG
jgi:anti-anti-sigma factor